MDTLENREKTLTSHEEKIGKALQIVRGLMDDLDHVNNFRSELEAEIVSETNKDSVVRRNAMLKAVSTSITSMLTGSRKPLHQHQSKRDAENV